VDLAIILVTEATQNDDDDDDDDDEVASQTMKPAVLTAVDHCFISLRFKRRNHSKIATLRWIGVVEIITIKATAARWT